MSAERFLKAFNQIDDHLRTATGIERGDRGFTYVVNEAAKRFTTVRRFADRLKQAATLRNAIVHDARYPERVIAEPHPDVVDDLERVVAAILNPPRVGTLFRAEVRQLDVTDPITRPLAWSRELRFSQFPVYAGDSFRGLLTARCIAQWLADRVPEEIMAFDGVTVGEVLARDETEGRNVEFIARDATWYDAAERFREGPRKERPLLEALLITERGRSTEALLGIITPWDLLEPPG